MNLKMAAVCLFLCSPILGAQQLSLDITSFGSEGPLERQALAALVPAYAALGIKIHIVELPGERAVQESNAGTKDGELLRRSGLEGMYPNLVRVNVVLARSKLVAFARTGTPRLGASWTDLKKTKFSYERGSKSIEMNTAGFPGASPVSTAEQGFMRLLDKSVDYLLVNEATGLEVLETMKAGTSFVVASEVLSEQPLYHYLNKKHAELVPLLEAALGQKPSR